MLHRGRFLGGLAAAVAVPRVAKGKAAAYPGDRARAVFAHGVIAPGRPMPEMTAPTTDGRELSLRSLRGHAVWINCFATWCQPCNQEMPIIVRAAKRYGSRGLRVVAISMSERAAVIPPFVHHYRITFPVLLDHEQATKVWGIEDIPTSIFLDAQGIVRTIHLGPLDRADVEAAVAEILPHDVA